MARDTSPTTPIQIRSPRLVPLVAALASAVVGIVAFSATPASATNEFPAKPSAEITFDCDTGGGYVLVELANDGGLSGAQFTIAVTGKADATVAVAPDTDPEPYAAELDEGGAYTVTVTADDGFEVTESIDEVDCYGVQGTIEQRCDGLQPYLEAAYTQTGEVHETITFDHDGTVESSSDPVVQFFTPVEQGAAFEATLSSAHSGQIAELSGVADCAVAETTTTTVTPTTVTPRVIAEQATPPAAPPVAPTELPRTGSSNGLLASIGLTLLGIGILLRRLAQRVTRI